jgi:hypothetical protein
MGKISRSAELHRNEWYRNNTKNYSLYFDKNNDFIVINKLKSVKNRAEYVRSLIRDEDEIFAKYAYSFHEKAGSPSKEDRTRIGFQLSRKTSQDVIDKLDAVANKRLYIRELVLNDLKEQK